mmetsp:Transcript_93148/g.268034  ORF Transcript_93148/g.268034 Transcript_93148/m.268034 type:complete len:138 (+) Transcript_93148:104-517(+)
MECAAPAWLCHERFRMLVIALISRHRKGQGVLLRARFRPSVYAGLGARVAAAMLRTFALLSEGINRLLDGPYASPMRLLYVILLFAAGLYAYQSLTRTVEDAEVARKRSAEGASGGGESIAGGAQARQRRPGEAASD